jgi:hypothetical protein
MGPHSASRTCNDSHPSIYSSIHPRVHTCINKGLAAPGGAVPGLCLKRPDVECSSRVGSLAPHRCRSMTRGRTRWVRPGDGVDIHPHISVVPYAPATADPKTQMLLCRRSDSHACRAARDCDGRHCRERHRHRATGAPVRVSPTRIRPPWSVGARCCERRVCVVHARRAWLWSRMPWRFPAQHAVRELFRSSASAWDGCPPCQSLSVFFFAPCVGDPTCASAGRGRFGGWSGTTNCARCSLHSSIRGRRHCRAVVSNVFLQPLRRRSVECSPRAVGSERGGV